MNLRMLIESHRPTCEQEVQDQRMMLQYMDLFDDLLHRSNEMAHFTSSSWIVNPDRTKVLMAYHNIYQSWAWTGGHADGDDDLLRVALREAQEEASLENIRAVSAHPISLEILPVCAHVRRGKHVVTHLHLNLTWLLEADDSQFIHCRPEENSAVGWFSPEDAVAASTEPDMQTIYRKLNSRISDH